MRLRHLFSLVMITVLVLVAGCGGGGGGSMNAPLVSGTASNLTTVSGRIDVPDSADDSGVLIQLMKKENGQVSAIARMISGDEPVSEDALRQHAPESGLYMGVTDAAGRFSIAGVPRDIYVLQASKGASFSAQREINLQTATDTTTTGGSVEIPAIQLTPTGTVIGTIITSPATTNLAGFLCYIEGTSHLGVTNSGGQFRLSGVPYNQEVTVTVSRPGFGLVRSNPVKITTAGQELSVGTLTLTLDTLNGNTQGISVTANSYMIKPVSSQASVTLTIAQSTGTTPSFMFFRMEAEGGAATTTTATGFATSQILNFTADGVYRITGFFIDATGVRSEVRLSQPVVVDGVPPVIMDVSLVPMSQPQVIGGEPGALHSRDLALRVDVRDGLSGPASLQLLLNGTLVGSTFTFQPGQKSATALVSGTLPAVNNGTGQADYTLGLQLTDQAGNSSSVTRTFPYHPFVGIEFDADEDEIQRVPFNLINKFGTNLSAVFMDGSRWFGFPADSVVMANGTLDADFNYTPPTSGDETVTVSKTIDGITKTLVVDIVFNELIGLRAEPPAIAIEAGNTRTLDFIQVFQQSTTNGDMRIPYADLTIAAANGSFSGLDYTAPLSGSDTLTITHVVNGTTQSANVTVNVFNLTGISAYETDFELGVGESKDLQLKGMAHYSNPAFDREIILTPVVSSGYGSFAGNVFSAPIIDGSGNPILGDVNYGVIALSYTGTDGFTQSATVNFNIIANPLIESFTVSPPPPTAGFAFLDFVTDQYCDAIVYYGTRPVTVPAGSNPLDFMNYYGLSAQPVGRLPQEKDITHRVVLQNLNDGLDYFGRIVVTNWRGQTTVGSEFQFVNGYTNINETIQISEAVGWTGFDEYGTPIAYGADNSNLTVGQNEVLYAYNVQNGTAGDEEMIRFDSIEFRGAVGIGFNYADLLQMRLFAVDEFDSLIEIPAELVYDSFLKKFRFRVIGSAPQYILPGNTLTFVVMGVPSAGAGNTMSFDLVNPMFMGMKSQEPKLVAPIMAIQGSIFNIIP